MLSTPAPPPACTSYLMGTSQTDNPQTGAVQQVSASLQLWGRERTCYQQWFSQSRVGDQTGMEHKKLLKGREYGGGRRREEERREAAYPPNHIFTLFKLYSAGQVHKVILTKSPDPWLATSKAREHRLWRTVVWGVTMSTSFLLFSIWWGEGRETAVPGITE